MKTQYLVAVAIIVTTGGAIVWQAASIPVAPPTAPATPLASGAPLLDGMLRPSEFPGVEVASLPDAPAQTNAAAKNVNGKEATGKDASGKPWIRVLPGGQLPAGGLGAREATTWRRETGKTALGGIGLYPEGKHMKSEIARRDKNGALVYQCTPGESAAAHAKHRHQQLTKAKVKAPK